MGVQAENLPLHFHHGITDTHVIVQMTRAVDNFQLTPEQAEKFISVMSQMLAELQKRSAGKGH